MADQEYTIILRGDAKQLEKELDGLGVKVKSVEKATDDAGKSSKGFGSALGDVGKVAGGFVLAQGMIAAPAILKSMSDTSRDLELQMKKQTIVFGDQLPVVDSWAKANAASMGLTNNEARNLAAGMADLLIPMGMTREAAAKMSTDTIGLAGALSEWSGGQKSAAEVSDILTKAYLGETDGLKALGIAISADEVAKRMAADGNDKLTGQAQAQAQALTIQQLILEKSTDAQTAYANGAGSAARKQAEMTAAVNQSKEELAMAMGPAIAFVTTKLAELVPVVIAAGKVFIEDMKPKVMAFIEFVRPILVELGALVAEKFAEFKVYYESDIKPALENIQKGVQAVIAFISEHWPEIEAVIRPIMEEIQNQIQLVMDIVMGIFKIVIDLIQGDFSGAWNDLKELVGNVMDSIVESVGNMIELVKGLAPLMLAAGKAIGGAILDGLGDALSATAGFAGDVAGAVLRAVKSVINDHVIGPINSALEFDVGAGPISFHVDAPDIPYLAKGGVITAPTLAVLGEKAPEAVIPLEQLPSIMGKRAPSSMGSSSSARDDDAAAKILQKLYDLKIAEFDIISSIGAETLASRRLLEKILAATGIDTATIKDALYQLDRDIIAA